ncbi:NADH:flavin oxidoreductase/NADH oxidase [Asticcacaulis sp. EMRT-3]|uniref:NADH:flavin oxidoreductase/NADH oxidase n=1 Tax=Asticcacaulis sp. EMRT-3 TaxID=3040349 RepID=UPI0024AED543|nr:NADH:flavin oxidoreductase/NADH oxidase [Asticcacaulis sp. EMRT-3]MDI7774266.1 NADH:flavin oxidoreductase/NADH oxidase [Asticcacaulis sp. EMRT-3]
MSVLFSPIALRSLSLRNRIVVSPMCQYSAENGRATDWHMIHLGHLALSGAGMLIIEATAVEADGRITPGDLGLYDEACEAALKPVLAAIRRWSDIPVAIQLGHAGRKASCHLPWEGGQQIAPDAPQGWRVHAPSDVPYLETDATPIALDKTGLERVKAAFVAAAQRAERLGIDAIEIHAAHGYLLHEFLSPLSNHRDDDYGGSLDNRMRFPLEVFKAVRDAFPADKPVGVRVSASDWVEGGWDIDQTVVFAKKLKALGVDWIDASSGALSPLQQIPVGPGYQVPFAAAIRETGVTTFAVGLITEAQQAEDILESGKADLVALARAMLYDPRWPWHAAAELGAQIDAPAQYWRSAPHGVKDLFRT